MLSAPAGRALSAGDLVVLLTTCEDRPLGICDAAIKSLFFGFGLGGAELVAINSGNYIKEESELNIRGKDNRQRTVPVGNSAGAIFATISISCCSTASTPTSTWPAGERCV
ncbi:MAG: hypothetical protein BMS9Abin02_0841 [Anaerolineae bacterium]|nr:MAG: hypothetical protein BMS9Abin02_0841 [Anaerolineae bacterium]